MISTVIVFFGSTVVQRDIAVRMSAGAKLRPYALEKPRDELRRLGVSLDPKDLARYKALLSDVRTAQAGGRGQVFARRPRVLGTGSPPAVVITAVPSSVAVRPFALPAPPAAQHPSQLAPALARSSRAVLLSVDKSNGRWWFPPRSRLERSDKPGRNCVADCRQQCAPTPAAARSPL
jgi:hypothetical protein